MSETVGLHTQLTADSGNFTQAMENARQNLSALAVEERKLKNEIALGEKELKKQSTAQGANGTETKKLETKLQQLLKKELDLKAGVKEVTDDVERQTKAYAKNASEADNVVSASDKIAKGLNVIKGIALGYAGKTLFSALIGSNAEFEQSMTSFDVLLGSADKATKLMEDLNKFGAETPFELPEITQATTQLLAFGTAEEDVMDKLQQLGDLSMGNAEKLDRITNAYGKMLAKGKVSLEELNMFTEAGVPILEELQKQYGVTQEELFKMITAGKVNIDGINAAMESMTSQGGQFFGMMEKQSQTMSGLWSTLTDNINIFAREVGEESFAYLKDELSGLMDTINQMEESGQLGEIAAELGEDIGNAVTFIGNFVKLLWEMKDVLTAAGAGVLIYKGAVGGLQTVMSAVNTLTSLYNVLSGKTVVCENTKTGAIITMTAAEYASIPAKEKATLAQAKLNAVMQVNPIALVVTAIVLLTGALVKLYGSYSDATYQANELNETLEENRKAVQESTKAYEENKKAITDKCDEQLQEVEVTKDYVRELETLSKKENKSAEDKERMQTLVNNLNSSIPNLNLAIDGTTGALNMETAAIWDAVDAWESYIKLLAMKELMVEAEKQVILTEMAYEDAKDRNEMITAGITAGDDYVKKIESGEIVDNSIYGGGNFYTYYEKAKDNKEVSDQEVIDSRAAMNKAKADKAKFASEVDKLEEETEGYDFSSGGTTSGGTTSGGTGGSGSDDAEAERKAKVTAYKTGVKNYEEDESRRNKMALEYGQRTAIVGTTEDGEAITETRPYDEDDYLAYLQNSAERYRGYVDQIMALDYMTAEEKEELAREYTQKAEDFELEAYKYNKELQQQKKELQQQEFEEFKEQAIERAEIAEKNYDFSGAVAQYEQIKAAAEDYFTRGIYSAKEYEQIISELNKKIGDAKYGEFQHWYADAQEYIDESNESGWENGDTEIAAWQRVQEKIQQAYDSGIILYGEYIDLIDDTNEKIEKKTREEMEQRIEDEETRLKEKYQNEYDITKKALDERLELIRENAQAEIDAIQERADAEIAAIDELIEARNREKEDQDDNLKMQRLQARLAYEMDEDNRIALQKEIDKLQEEIDDKLFEREMSDKKEAISAAAEAQIAALNAEIEEAERDYEYESGYLEEQLAKRTSGTAIADEIYKNLGIFNLEEIAKGLSEDSLVAEAVKTIQNSLNSMNGISNTASYYTTNAANYAPVYNVYGSSPTPSELRKTDEARYLAYLMTRRFS